MNTKSSTKKNWKDRVVAAYLYGWRKRTYHRDMCPACGMQLDSWRGIYDECWPQIRKSVASNQDCGKI